MQLGYQEIVERLNEAALGDGGWRGRGDGPSVTVSSEVALALMEHLEQVPPPSNEETKLHPEGLVEKIDRAIAVVVGDVKKRDDLDLPNCALGLAAYTAHRTFTVRSGQALDDVDEEFVDKALAILSKVPGVAAMDIGAAWAYIKGIELTDRVLAYQVDPELKAELDVAGFNYAITIQRGVRANLLADHAANGVPQSAYAAVVLLDLAISTIMDSPGEGDGVRVNAHKVKVNSIAIIDAACYDYNALTVFPIKRLQNNAENNQYNVIVVASLLTSLARLIEDDNLRNDAGEIDRLKLFFYGVADSIPEIVKVKGAASFELAHCLRSLAEVKVNERDVKSVMSLFRHVEKEKLTRTSVVSEVEELADQLKESPPAIWFGSPNRLFLLASATPYLVLVLSLLLSFYAIGVLIQQGELTWAFGISAFWVFLLTLPTSFHAWAISQSFYSKTKEQRRALLVHYVFTGALAGLVLVSAVYGWTGYVIDQIRELRELPIER